MVSGREAGGAAAPPIFGDLCSKIPPGPPSGPRLFSTCPPNNFLPDTPLAPPTVNNEIEVQIILTPLYNRIGQGTYFIYFTLYNSTLYYYWSLQPQKEQQKYLQPLPVWTCSFTTMHQYIGRSENKIFTEIQNFLYKSDWANLIALF